MTLAWTSPWQALNLAIRNGRIAEALKIATKAGAVLKVQTLNNAADKVPIG